MMIFLTNQVPFACGEMLVGLIAYYIQNWQTLQQVLSGIVLGMILLWYLMPESPRWLLSKNKYQEALKVLTNGSKLNRRPLPEGFLRYDDQGICLVRQNLHNTFLHCMKVRFTNFLSG